MIAPLLLADGCVAVFIPASRAHDVGQDDRLLADLQHFIDDELRELAGRIERRFAGLPFEVRT